MKRFLASISFISTLFLSLHASAAPEVAPREWYQCANDSDCIFVPGYCSENTTINKKFSEPYNEMMARSTVRCAKTDKRIADATPSCADGYCAMNIPGDFYKRN